MKKILSLLCCLLVLHGCSMLPSNPTEPSESAPSDPVQTQPSQAPSVPVPSQPVTVPSVPTAPSDPPAPADPILERIAAMTLEEKVGQIFLARCPDVGALEDIARYHLGGFVLFARDFEGETPDTVRATIEEYQSASKIPMLMAVDEEGGTVTRVSRYKAFRNSRFPSPRDLFAAGGKALVLSTEAEKCELLLSLGVNVNLAPVCDITTDPAAFMYKRSLGLSPEETGDVIAGMVDVMGQHGLGGVLKHFPGYGNNTDTHVAIAVDNRSLEDLESVDLVPFAYGIRAGCDAIMVSHVYINAIDSETPATLSPAVHEYLRQEMGFEGVIVTDDLVMAAITDIYGVGESAVLAVLAGNDLLCVTDYAEQYEAVLQAVKDGRISIELLEQAVYRILVWKTELGLLP